MLVDVIAIPVPTFTCANVPDCVKFTTSGLITPTKVPPVTLAVFVRSYCLFVVVAPVTVNGLGVIVKSTVFVLLKVPRSINVRTALTWYVPTEIGLKVEGP